MNKRPLTTTIVTHLVRGASFIVLLFIGTNMIRFAQAQPQSNKRLQINSETSPNGVRGPVGTKTLVRVHDTAERTQIAALRQNNSLTSPGAPSGTSWGVECNTHCYTQSNTEAPPNSATPPDAVTLGHEW